MKATKPTSEALRAAVSDMAANTFDTDKIEFDSRYSADVPPVDDLYVPFGHYTDIERITVDGSFFPYWISGLSGNGKTLGIEQAHARNNKRLVNTPITREADEDSLLGGLRLENGNTVPFFGPVTLGAILGCTVNLDEIDLGDEKLMCLQTALQNRPFMIKRLGKMIYPQKGFNVVATANTKGQGSVDGGTFIGTRVMNEAMLDRFICVFEQDYPETTVERQILLALLKSMSFDTPADHSFVERLLSWANQIRQLRKTMMATEVITTRRLTHICKAYKMFQRDRSKAVDRCLTRFQADVKTSFRELYDLIDAEATKQDKEQTRVAAAVASGMDPETPFA